MAVKDLVGLFEAQSPDSSSSRSSPRVSSRRRSHSPAALGVPRTPARFLRNPLFLEQAHVGEKADGLPARTTTAAIRNTTHEINDQANNVIITPTRRDVPFDISHSTETPSYTSYKLEELSSDVTDELLHQTSSASMNSRRDSTTVIGSTGAEYEMHSFLTPPDTISDTSRTSHTLRPRSPFRPKSLSTSSLASTSTVVQSLPSLSQFPNTLGVHHPIPATTVFARSALPLSLPALDKVYFEAPATCSSLYTATWEREEQGL
ncbi:hypothetical protein QCA50_001914 [Cerrena zonata]|uniref:Uncharacterized protein n=1 Tax=Cerrena zonata TaxID=2478898 RepID=A0AAW0GY36_9APHY